MTTITTQLPTCEEGKSERMATQKTSKKTKTKKKKADVKPVSTVGGGQQGGLLSAVSQASGQGRS